MLGFLYVFARYFNAYVDKGANQIFLSLSIYFPVMIQLISENPFLILPNLQEINSLIDLPQTLGDREVVSWEFPENVDHDDLLKKTDEFIKKLTANKKFNDIQISSQRCIFYLIFGILGSAGVHLVPGEITSETQLQIGQYFSKHVFKTKKYFTHTYIYSTLYISFIQHAIIITK